jgi:hypothetical protein
MIQKITGRLLVSCFGKLFTSNLCNRLTDFSDEILLLSESQCVFRKGYSTIDCIFVLNLFFDILKFKKRNYFVHFRFLKKKKEAFDTIRH